MDIELQDKLFKKYPNLFCQKDLPKTQTCMCWGISTGNGWYDLIDKTCNKLTNLNIEELAFVQVKQKLGGLTIYPNGGSDEIWRILKKAKEESYKICEECGIKDNLSTCTIGGFWIKSLCKKCMEKEQNETS